VCIRSAYASKSDAEITSEIAELGRKLAAGAVWCARRICIVERQSQRPSKSEDRCSSSDDDFLRVSGLLWRPPPDQSPFRVPGSRSVRVPAEQLDGSVAQQRRYPADSSTSS
jgi:hypothetical protein